jgi:hypothetical protein
LLAAPLVNAGPPNPTPSDTQGNTAGGTNAPIKNTTGSQNMASGVNALYANQTGNHNTAHGLNALHTNTNGMESRKLFEILGMRSEAGIG